ncbi:MAG: peptidoglycan-binding domain-containing protein [Candidatus Paceibacterota bacterium]|jgi:hypothetical protein
MKKIILATFLLFPTFAFAQIPDFPMAFYGSVTINSNPAPSGSVVKAYYGSIALENIAGEIVVKANGIYGDDTPIGPKLLVTKDDGEIVFTIQSPSISNNQETGGSSEVSYPNFESGSVHFNLAFTYESPVPPSTQTSSNGSSGSRSGGGGGGGGSSRIAPATSLPSGQVLGASTYNFSRNLSVGSSGEDVTELQKILTSEGVYTGPITGYFGSLTKLGVITFQKKYSIDPVGIVGPATRAKLNSSATQTTTTGTMTIDQMKTLLAQLQAQLTTLIAKLNASVQ